IEGGKVARVSLIEEGKHPELAGLIAAIKAERGGRLANLYRALLNSPAVAEGWLKLFTAVRQKAKLAGRWSSSPPPSRATTWFRGFWWPCRSTRSAPSPRPELAASGEIGRDKVEAVRVYRIHAPGKQTPGDLRVVHRIAEKPVARAANLLRLRGCQVFAVAVHGDAPERLRGIAPIRLDPVGEKSAIELRRGRARRLESDALEGREQRRRRGTAPQLQR